MKTLFVLLIFIFGVLELSSLQSVPFRNGGKEIVLMATCTGKTPCSACANCTGCKHCKTNGGKCGTCKK